MGDVWIYLDESGTADFSLDSSNSPYFAFGSAALRGDQGALLQAFVSARASRRGLLNGFHAYNDSMSTRSVLFDVMSTSGASFASTFLAKANAYPWIQERPKIWLYQYALYLHLKAAIPRESDPGDTVNVVAAHITMDAKQEALEQAVAGVCRQLGRTRDVRHQIWRAPSSAGLQVADYALWATQRVMVQGKNCHFYDRVVAPQQRFCHFPWLKDLRGSLTPRR